MKNLQTEPRKVLRVGVVRQTVTAWFIKYERTEVLNVSSNYCLPLFIMQYFALTITRSVGF